MYNRYVQNGGAAIPFDPMENTLNSHRRREHDPRDHHESHERHETHQMPVPVEEKAVRKKGGIGNLLSNLHLDTGDLLIILLMVLLYMDGEDNELLLVLGLMLFLDI